MKSWSHQGALNKYQLSLVSSAITKRFFKNFACMAKPLTTLTLHNAKFTWMQTHQTAFETLKCTLIKALILHCQSPSKCYIVYTDASENACRAQLCQEHNNQEMPVKFLSHTFTETQWKWSTPGQEAYGVYYTITK